MMDVRPTVDDQRCVMAVSEELVTLRAAQAKANQFAWSTEVACAYARGTDDPRLADPTRLIHESLPDLHTNAWTPNAQGNVKYKAKVETFRIHLGEISGRLFGSIAIGAYSAFEQYLTGRVGPFIGGKHEKWGPLTKHLCIPALVSGPHRIGTRELLMADLCRCLRNALVHGATEIRDEGLAEAEGKWIRGQDEATTEHRKKGTPTLDFNAHRAFARSRVIDEMQREARQAAAAGRPVSNNLFVALYSLANFDALAIQIEQALIPPGQLPPGRINVRRRLLFRHDLIVPAAPGGG